MGDTRFSKPPDQDGNENAGTHFQSVDDFRDALRDLRPFEYTYEVAVLVPSMGRGDAGKPPLLPVKKICWDANLKKMIIEI
jgi:hypothetical protein